MTQRDYLFLGLLGLVIFLVVATFQADPGYMDADYYFAGGIQLASGNGFTEPYLWNYLDDPSGLPHPSHTYWMPLASIFAALIPTLTKVSSWFTSRLPFILMAGCIPPITAALAYSFTRHRALAAISGLLAIFPGFYLPFLTTTDTFSLYLPLGGLFFLVVNNQIKNQKHPVLHSVFLGLLAGLMHLSRADGLIWLVVAFVAVILFDFPYKLQGSIRHRIICLFSTFGGYLLIMAPWFVRNYYAFGGILAPGGSRMFWLTSYDQIFSFPATGLTFTNWLSSGVGNILKARAWALGLNLANTLTVQGSIFLLPLILVGVWHLRREKGIIIAVLSWLLILAAMTLAFPFAGARGGFFHSGAALQTLWWAVTPIGLERVIEWGSKHRGWLISRARSIFVSGLIALTVVFSFLVFMMRIPDWGKEASVYRAVDALLETEGITSRDIVIVSNPPGFYLASMKSAIAVPDGNLETVLELAARYGARYLVLEEGSIPTGLLSVYASPQNNPDLNYVGEAEGARVYAIQP